MALHKHSNALVDVLPPEADSSIAMLGADEKPDVSYADIGGNAFLRLICITLNYFSTQFISLNWRYSLYLLY